LSGNATGKARGKSPGSASGKSPKEPLEKSATTSPGTGDEKPGGNQRGGKQLIAGQAEAKPRLLAGGNPQIPKGDGDAPVQAYIEAMPGWKRDVGRKLDALVEANVPDVRKAVRWNSPFYGVEGQGWFLSYHCYTRFVKVTFFRGTSLSPVPPGESKHEEVRYFDIHEDAELDEEQLSRWIRQAAELPGWVP